MIYSIVAYGDPILKKVASEINKYFVNLNILIDNMFKTMYSSHGVGLAAPQIGQSIRVFVIDTTPFKEEYPDTDNIKQVFINPELLDENGKEWSFNEGCLSIPGIREDISRKPNIKVKYFDENWVMHEHEFSGIVARVIQHEYDHLEGKLFIEQLSTLKKTLLKGKLTDISKGKVDVDYKMRFFKR